MLAVAPPAARLRVRSAAAALVAVTAALCATVVSAPAAGAAPAAAPSAVVAQVQLTRRQVVEHRALSVRVVVYDADPGDASTPTGTVTVADAAPAGDPVPLLAAALVADPADPSSAYADVGLPTGLEELHDLSVSYGGDATHAASTAVRAGLEVVSADEPAAQQLQRLYLDVLGRTPDADGYAYWLPVVRGRGNAADAAWSFVRSPEYLSGEVLRAYTAFLHRDPDAGGLAYYTDLLGRGVTVQDLKTDLMNSAEYAASAGARAMNAAGHAAFLDAVYEDALGRAPDASGQAYYLNLLTTKRTSRANIAYELAVSDEHQRSFLDDAYGALLERTVDDGGQAYWARQVRGGYRQELVVYSIATSPEYRSLLGS